MASKIETEAKLKMEKIFVRSQEIKIVCKTLTKTSWPICIATCAYFFSGKTTIANINSNLLHDILGSKCKEMSTIGIILGIIIVILTLICIITSIWAIKERSLKRNCISDKSKTITNLEAKIDQNRTSSNLNHDGTTKAEDRCDD